jgi:hypothetical protein
MPEQQIVEHRGAPSRDRVSDAAEAVELEIEKPRRIVEGVAPDDRNDGSEVNHEPASAFWTTGSGGAACLP